jgi:hypothetical protein
MKKDSYKKKGKDSYKKKEKDSSKKKKGELLLPIVAFYCAAPGT